MTIGVLLVSHESLGHAMLDISVKTLSVCPLATRVLNVPLDDDPDALAARAEKMVTELDSGDGVLILTDLCGATPSNIACRLVRLHDVMVVAGLNLSMLIRVLNYPELSLTEMAERAVDGGRQGVMLLPGRNEA
ncbi:MAG TPA: PTS fructose transporter subunit IIA [Gammaproteobacteria bacterium]|nr:PTS fructose transporter subunit IIA [Gammaproteobacteria bacterium]